MTATENIKHNKTEDIAGEVPATTIVGITGGTLAVACFFSVVLSVAGSWFVQKISNEPENTPPYKIAILDSQKVLNAEMKALMTNASLQTNIEAENKRFSRELSLLIQQKAAEGYIIIHKEAIVSGDAQTTDLTNLFLNQLVPKPVQAKP
jgi:hypothetical protein